MTKDRRGPEFSLLVQCCRRNFASEDQQSSLEIPTNLDWNHVVVLARRHRIQGLVWNTLAHQGDRLPTETREILSSDARSIAATNLAIAGECRELLQTFDRAKVPLRFIKGLTIGALAYRSPLLKMGWDIDLLIDPWDLATAAGLLSESGYALRLPSSLAALQHWHARSKESVWERDESFYVELHTRLADNQRVIPTIDIHSPWQFVEVAPGVSLPTLADDELFAYLAVHGASSAWFRLKWISDFAAFVHGRSTKEIERLFRRSQELGAGRAAGQAMLLADSLFDTLQPDFRLREQLASDRSTQVLCRAALRMLMDWTAEPTGRPLGTMTIHWTQFLLQPGLDFKISELRRQGDSLLRRLRH